MEASAESKGIYEAMAKVMEEMPAIAKEQTLDAGPRYNFRGIDDVYNKVQPLLARHGIFVLPHCVAREQTQISKGIRVLCRMRYSFCHRDGSSVSCEVVGEALDTSDKATNKAMSIAMKYALFQMFCIPTKDMADPDREFIEDTPQPRQKPEAKAKGWQKKSWDECADYFFEVFHDAIQNDARHFYGDISNFLGRQVLSINDLSEQEMEAYLQATKVE